jgi:hypothetical protein
MTDVTAEAHVELRGLCRGRGVLAADLDARVGPALHRLAALPETADRGARRAVLTDWLRARVAGLPDDLRLVAGVALGLDPRAPHRLLKDRLGWLAVELDRDPRTVRRRADEAIRLLAEMLVDPDSGSAVSTVSTGSTVPTARDSPGPPGVAGTRRATSGRPVPDEHDPVLALGGPAGGWYTERVRALVRLDGPTPELIEERRVVALADGVSELTLAMSLPQVSGNRTRPASPADGDAGVGSGGGGADGAAGEPDHLGSGRRRDLGMDVVYGGRLTRRARRGDTYFALALRLPRPLRAGERHQFACRWLIPPGQPMVPRYALTPMSRCDSLVLRVRFPPGAAPEVRLLDGVPPRTVDDHHVELPALELDDVGEAVVAFSRLSIGLCYGVRWG